MPQPSKEHTGSPEASVQAKASSTVYAVIVRQMIGSGWKAEVHVSGGDIGVAVGSTEEDAAGIALRQAIYRKQMRE